MARVEGRVVEPVGQRGLLLQATDPTPHDANSAQAAGAGELFFLPQTTAPQHPAQTRVRFTPGTPVAVSFRIGSLRVARDVEWLGESGSDGSDASNEERDEGQERAQAPLPGCGVLGTPPEQASAPKPAQGPKKGRALEMQGGGALWCVCAPSPLVVVGGGEGQALHVWSLEGMADDKHCDNLPVQIPTPEGGFTCLVAVSASSVVAATTRGAVVLVTLPTSSRMLSAPDAVNVAVVGRHEACVRSLAAASRGDVAVSGDANGYLKVWHFSRNDRHNSNPGHSFKGHNRQVSDIAFLDSTRAVSVSGDGAIKVWNTATGECEQAVSAPQPLWRVRVLASAASSDSIVVVTGRAHDPLLKWNLTRGQCIERISLCGLGRAWGLCAWQDTHLALAGTEGLVQVRPLSNLSECAFVESHGAALAQLTRLDGTTMLSLDLGSPSRVNMWQAANAEPGPTNKGARVGAKSPATAPDEASRSLQQRLAAIHDAVRSVEEDAALQTDSLRDVAARAPRKPNITPLARSSMSRLNLFLNQITPENFARVGDKTCAYVLENCNDLGAVARTILGTAINFTKYATLYASLCVNITRRLASAPPPQDNNHNSASEAGDFRQVLLRECELAFDNALQRTGTRCSGDSAHIQSNRHVSLVRFVGSLFLVDMLPRAVVVTCMHQLLKTATHAAASNHKFGAELCVTMTTSLFVQTGKKLDVGDPGVVDAVLHELAAVLKRGATPRAQFLVQGAQELRAAGWVPRRAPEEVRPVSAIRKEFASVSRPRRHRR